MSATKERKAEIIAENRLHEKVPFGVVAARWDIGISESEGGPKAAKMLLNFKLADFGEGAKSKFPEQQ